MSSNDRVRNKRFINYFFNPFFSAFRFSPHFVFFLILFYLPKQSHAIRIRLSFTHPLLVILLAFDETGKRLSPLTFFIFTLPPKSSEITPAWTAARHRWVPCSKNKLFEAKIIKKRSPKSFFALKWIVLKKNPVFEFDKSPKKLLQYFFFEIEGKDCNDCLSLNPTRYRINSHVAHSLDKLTNS